MSSPHYLFDLVDWDIVPCLSSPHPSSIELDRTLVQSALSTLPADTILIVRETSENAHKPSTGKWKRIKCSHRSSLRPKIQCSFEFPTHVHVTTRNVPPLKHKKPLSEHWGALNTPKESADAFGNTSSIETLASHPLNYNVLFGPSFSSQIAPVIQGTNQPSSNPLLRLYLPDALENVHAFVDKTNKILAVQTSSAESRLVPRIKRSHPNSSAQATIPTLYVAPKPIVYRHAEMTMTCKDFQLKKVRPLHPLHADCVVASNAQSPLVLMEYMEQHPFVIQRVGMHSSLRVYHRPSSEEDQTRIQSTEGEHVYVHQYGTSPFLAPLRKGVMAACMENNLFVAPLVKHQPPPCTYILRYNARHKQWTILPMPSSYVVGQLEPKCVVPSPFSDTSLELLEMVVFKFLQCYWTEHPNAILKESTLRGAFPYVSSSRLLRMMETKCTTVYMEDGSRGWRLRERMEEATLSAEDLCRYMSIQTGEHALQKRHFNWFRNWKHVHRLVEMLPSTIEWRYVAEYINTHLQKTPWAYTAHFEQLRHGYVGFPLIGPGNPFPKECGYSLVSDPPPHVSKLHESSKKANTDADLRKLTMKRTKKALKGFGLGETEIEEMNRWDRIRTIAAYSTEHVQESQEMRRFARTVKRSGQGKLEMQMQQIEHLFHRQLRYLARVPFISSNHQPRAPSASKLAAAAEEPPMPKLRRRMRVLKHTIRYIDKNGTERTEVHIYRSKSILNAFKQDCERGDPYNAIHLQQCLNLEAPSVRTSSSTSRIDQGMFRDPLKRCTGPLVYCRGLPPPEPPLGVVLQVLTFK
jgi:hypothetical protein